MLAQAGWTEQDLPRRLKSDPVKVKIATRLGVETTMSWKWIARNYAWAIGAAPPTPCAWRKDEICTYSAPTPFRLFTGGKSLPKQYGKWVINGFGNEILDKQAEPQAYPYGDPGFPSYTARCMIEPQAMNIGGLGRLFSNGNLYTTLPNGTFCDLTPRVSGNDFYMWAVAPWRPRKIKMSRSYHPYVKGAYEVVDVQKELDRAGDNRLALDQDGWRPDGTPGADDNDDVPVYVEFEIPDAAHLEFPASFDGEDFTAQKYAAVETWDDAVRLIRARFANIKQVRDLGWKDIQDGVFRRKAGMGWPYAGAIIFSVYYANPNLSPYVPTDLVLAHEFGHTASLVHRDLVLLGETPNPGDDPLAIMRDGPPDPNTNELNRREKAFIENWDREFWNDW